MATIQLNKDDEWETPDYLYNQALLHYGVKPTLDVCATRLNRKCLDYFDNNALGQDWNQDFFMNPPYSELSLWVEKAYKEHVKHNVNGMALIFSKTDTKTWHEYIEKKAEVHFIKGRIKFCKNGLPGKHPAPYPSCWVIWRKK